METGFLKVKTTTASGHLPVQANIIIANEDQILYNIQTDESGITQTVEIEAPPIEQALDPDFKAPPYSTVNVAVEAEGFATVNIHGVQIFDTITSILPINMVSSWETTSPLEYHIPVHKLIEPSTQSIIIEDSPSHQDEVQIPEYIGDTPFTDYIKKKASQEIYPTWPPSVIEANIYAITSQTLTQASEIPEHTQIFHNIDEMVDSIFNRYIVNEGAEPYFTEYSDGRHYTCPGMWQWGALALANRDHNALDILHHYYPSTVEIVETSNIAGIEYPFPGFPLQEGMRGEYVQKLQIMLNRVRENYTVIPELNVNGFFDPETTAAVQAFKHIYELSQITQTGIVDKNTWHRISLTYSTLVKKDHLHEEDINYTIPHSPRYNYPDIANQMENGLVQAKNPERFYGFLATDFTPAKPMTQSARPSSQHPQVREDKTDSGLIHDETLDGQNMLNSSGAIKKAGGYIPTSQLLTMYLITQLYGPI
ncbi:MAG: peptidoglycan-binding protein [Defluviitaleaceae bacterium]|nr:peptidoglycan-binding protein [Defluviitaleaceae bacterium]